MIGGNIEGILQKNVGSAKNALGEMIQTWTDEKTLTGWLDLSAGDSKYTYNAKLQESTHVFICDYAAIDRKADDKRLIVDGTAYDVLLIDNPMELGTGSQLEFYLKFTGGQ